MPYRITPRQLNPVLWVFERDGKIVATAIKMNDREWTAKLAPDLCGECMNFVTFTADSAAMSIEGLFKENVALCKSMLVELTDISVFSDLSAMDDVLASV